MEPWLIRITDYLLAQSWQIVVLTIVVALATFGLRNRSAHVRYLLWLIVLAKALVPPLYSIPVAVLPQQEPRAYVSAPPIAESVATEHRVPEAAVTESPRPAAVQSQAALSPAVSRRLAMYDTRAWLAIGWLAGAAALLSYYLLNTLRTQIWLQRWRKALPSESARNIESFFASHGVRHMPRVWLLERINQPFVWGLVCGSIYLPARLLDGRHAKFQASLLGHELSHVIRLDAMINSLQVLAQTVFWFHPFVWWANAKIRAEREKCCDEMTIARLNAPPEEYSEAIVEALAAKYKQARPVPSLAVAGQVKNIEERIKTMLKPGKRFHKRPSLVAATVALLIALVTIPTALVLTARAASMPPADSAGADLIFDNPTNLGPSVNSPDEDYETSISADELELYFNSLRPGGLGQSDLWVATRKTKADPWGKAVNLGPTVNGPAGDKSPCISADSLSLYFSSDRPGGCGAHDLWVTTRKTKSAPWGEPVNLGPTVNSPADELAPSISTDGLELYFSGHSAFPEAARPGGSGESDLWVTTRKTTHDPWGTPVNLGPTVNSPFADASPSISGDGLSLYFNSDRPGGSGGDTVVAIWVTRRKSTSAPWGAAVNLGPAVNAYWEVNPEISRDGSTLYFSSRRPGGLGGSDTWQATLGRSTPESEAAQLAASLLGAVKVGDIEQVKLLLSRGAEINATDSLGRTALHGAVANGRKDIVQLLLAQGANVDATDASGQTPLHWASARPAWADSALLLAKGAKVNARDNRGNTPLHCAAGSTYSVGADFLEFLLAQGADVNARNEQGQTPLHLVSLTRRQHKQRELRGGALLAHGAQVDATDKTGRTPLHVAAQNGQAMAVELLLAKGAVDRRANDGLLALHRALLGGHKDVVTALLSQSDGKQPDVNATRPGGETALHDAAKAGYNEIAELLIAKGADVNAKNAHGETPEQLALARDPPGTVRLLRAKGAEACTIQLTAYLGDLAEVKGYTEKGTPVDAQDGSGLTALHAAAAGGQKEVTEFLIATGAAVNAASGKEGLGTPLHYAAHGGSLEVAELLLLKGASVGAQNNRGETPLHLAAQMGHTDLCRLLIAAKGDVNLRTQNGWTPLHYAADSGQKAAAALLLEKGADMDAKDRRATTPLEVAASELETGDGASDATKMDAAATQRYRDVMKFLIDEGADVSSADLLYHVVWRGEKEITEALIKKGANVNTVSRSWGGYPVPLYASWSGNPAVLELLLAHGANPNADDGGWSLLHYEIWADDARMAGVLLDKGANPNYTVFPGCQSPLQLAAQLGRQAQVELLIARGADPNLKDYDGRTPLSLAKEKGYGEIVEFLRQHGAKE